MAPKVLVLGGVGFIGRTLVSYLIENNLCSLCRVVDKVLPATAYLSETHKAHFADPKVEFKQANLCNAASCEKAFTIEGGGEFDIVFDLASETKYGQAEAVYEEKVFKIAVVIGTEAAKRRIPVFVEVSTAQLYDGGKKAATEDSKIKPWTLVAKAKAKAEDALREISGLNLILIRPSVVYGPNDVLGITPRLIIGAVYKHLKEEMKLLWTKDLKINTVHVRDVVRALWFIAAQKGDKGGRSTPVTAVEVYNLSDKTDTDQGTVNDILAKIFKIETGFQGTMISQFAKLNLDSVTEDVNDKHLQPWSELLKNAGVTNSPLTPYLDKELLKDNYMSVDGSKIEKQGFVYEVPEMTLPLLEEVIDSFVTLGVWPQNTK